MAFAYSYNDEEYNEGGFKTIEDALEQALENNDTEELVRDGYIFVYVGKELPYTDNGSDIFWRMIEHFQEMAHSESEYCNEDYLENIKDDDREWIEEKLDNLWDEFKNRIKESPPFYSVVDVNKYKICIDGTYEEVEYEK